MRKYQLIGKRLYSFNPGEGKEEIKGASYIALDEKNNKIVFTSRDVNLPVYPDTKFNIENSVGLEIGAVEWDGKVKFRHMQD